MKTRTKPLSERAIPKSFSLYPAQWCYLVSVERLTGAKPSTTIQRLIERAMKARKLPS
jgi:hypothetical protein